MFHEIAIEDQNLHSYNRKMLSSDAITIFLDFINIITIINFRRFTSRILAVVCRSVLDTVVDVSSLF